MSEEVARFERFLNRNRSKSIREIRLILIKRIMHLDDAGLPADEMREFLRMTDLL